MGKEEQFFAAAYLRLSDADGEQGESNSIGNQRRLIQEFVKGKEEIHLCAEWVDDGVSGASFQRPAFQAMMDEVQAGRINCIIVKDLSRFGRNYIEAGNFLERIFPMLGVRFIAINDYIDSNRLECQQDFLTIPFLNLVNDAYLRDISIKIRSQFSIKRKNGEFIGAFAVYGYCKDPEKKGHLIIDGYASQIVRRIFFWSLEGASAGWIAERLEGLGILSPYAYKMAQGRRYKTGFQTHRAPRWTPSAVKRILTNEVYCGHMVQGKELTPNYRMKKKLAVPKQEWVKVSNTHEAIVTGELFRLVQKRCMTDTRTAPKQEKIYLLSGFLYCSSCRQLLSRKLATAGKRKYPYYICSTYKRDRFACSSHRISEGQVLTAVQKSIGAYYLAFVEGQAIPHWRAMEKRAEMQRRRAVWYAMQIQKMEQEQKEKLARQRQLAQDLEQGKVQREEFAAFFKFYAEDAKGLQQRIAQLCVEKAQAEDAAEAWEQKWKSWRNFGGGRKACALRKNAGQGYGWDEGRRPVSGDGGRREIGKEAQQGQEGLSRGVFLDWGEMDRVRLLLLMDNIMVYEKNKICIHFQFQTPFSIVGGIGN